MSTSQQPDGAEAAGPVPIPVLVEPAPVPAAAGGVLSRPYLALSLGIVSVVLLIAFEATAVGTAMPVAARELHGVPLYAFAFSAYFTTSLFAMVLAGQWADRAGPLAPITLGIGGFAAGLLLCGTAGSMWVFVLGRAVQGLGGGLVIVALYVVVSRAYPRRLQPAILAAFSACWVVPSVVGPLIAGTVTEHLGWRWVFLGIPLLILLPLLIALPQIRRRAAGPLPDAAPAPRGRLAWAFALSLAAGLLQYAAGDLNRWSLPPALVGAVLLALAVRVLLPRGTWRAARGLPAVVLLRGVAAGAFIAAESFVPLMLVTQRGLSPTLAGLSLALGGSTWAFGSWVQARPAWSAYRRTFMTFGMVLVAGAIATAPGVLLSWTPVWIVAVAWGFGCFGMGIVTSGTSTLLLELSAPEEAGTNSAALQMSDGLSNVLLLALGGAAFAAAGGGAVGAAHDLTAGGTDPGHPAAFAAVFLPLALVAAVGVGVARRTRE
ncbi:MFS transporter [Streptomyces sp. CA-253872]|uniref:MFS transporter n=1 Tax=Streptomyces sp. CA-253872 TaxID=3240067 RepID=UPI003D8F2AC4